MPLERLAFDNGNFKSAMENFKNSKTKERESFDRTITDKNNELNDLQVKWGASSRWKPSLYSPVRNSDQMTNGTTHPTLFSETGVRKFIWFVATFTF